MRSIRCRIPWIVTLLAAVGTCGPRERAVAQTSKADDELSFLEDEEGELTIDEALSRGLKIVDDLDAQFGDMDDKKRAEDIRHVDQLSRFVLSKDPINKTAGYLQGRIAWLLNRPREAIQYIENYIGTQREPGPGFSDWYAHKLLGDLRLVSYPELARPEYRKAADLAPDKPEPIHGLAQVEFKMNRAAEAVDFAQRAVQIDRERKPRYRVMLVRALSLAKKYEEAVTTAREVIDLGEERVRAKPGDLTLLSELLGYYRLFEQSMAQMLVIYPENPDYVLRFVRAWQDRADLQRLLEYHSALRTLEKQREYEGFEVSVDLLMEEANLNRIVGRTEQAVNVLGEVLDRDPDHVAAKQMLETLAPSTSTVQASQ